MRDPFQTVADAYLASVTIVSYEIVTRETIGGYAIELVKYYQDGGSGISSDTVARSSDDVIRFVKRAAIVVNGMDCEVSGTIYDVDLFDCFADPDYSLDARQLEDLTDQYFDHESDPRLHNYTGDHRCQRCDARSFYDLCQSCIADDMQVIADRIEAQDERERPEREAQEQAETARLAARYGSQKTPQKRLSAKQKRQILIDRGWEIDQFPACEDHAFPRVRLSHPVIGMIIERDHETYDRAIVDLYRIVKDEPIPQDDDQPHDDPEGSRILAEKREQYQQRQDEIALARADSCEPSDALDKDGDAGYFAARASSVTVAKLAPSFDTDATLIAYFQATDRPYELLARPTKSVCQQCGKHYRRSLWNIFGCYCSEACYKHHLINTCVTQITMFIEPRVMGEKMATHRTSTHAIVLSEDTRVIFETGEQWLADAVCEALYAHAARYNRPRNADHYLVIAL